MGHLYLLLSCAGLWHQGETPSVQNSLRILGKTFGTRTYDIDSNSLRSCKNVHPYNIDWLPFFPHKIFLPPPSRNAIVNDESGSEASAGGLDITL